MADVNTNLKRALDGPLSQHKLPGLEDTEVTEGTDGGLHTKIIDSNGNPIDPREVNNASVVAELQAVKQQNADILAKLNGSIDTNSTVTGSNVANQKVIVFPSIAITDTSIVTSADIDLSGFSSFSVYARNTLGVDVSLGYTLELQNAKFYNGTDWVLPYPNSTGSASIASGSYIYDLNTFWPQLNNNKITTMSFRAKTSSTPTGGNLYVFVIGRG